MRLLPNTVKLEIGCALMLICPDVLLNLLCVYTYIHACICVYINIHTHTTFEKYPPIQYLNTKMKMKYIDK